MPITQLDPNVALIVIDLQKGIASRPTAQPVGAVIERAASLATAFRRHRLPVVLVNVSGGAPGRVEQKGLARDLPPDWTELVPELDQQPDDLTITKRTWGAFTNTDLDARLRELGVTQVVIVGVSTSAGVESTARFAHELGYNVFLATDAMADLSPEAHTNSISRIFPRSGEKGNKAALTEALDRFRSAT